MEKHGRQEVAAWRCLQKNTRQEVQIGQPILWTTWLDRKLDRKHGRGDYLRNRKRELISGLGNMKSRETLVLKVVSVTDIYWKMEF